MSGYTITMSCPHCEAYVPITDNDLCIACGKRLMPDFQSIERPCMICGQSAECPVDDDDPWPVCHDCIVAVVWDGERGHETLDARLARLGAAS